MNEMAKNSFVIYHNYLEILEDLTDEQVGKLFRAMLKYDRFGEEPAFDSELKIAFKFIKKDLDYNKETYENICKRNRENGNKGGRPKNPENPVGYLETQENPEKPKKPDNDNDNDNDIYNIKEKNKKGNTAQRETLLATIKQFFCDEEIISQIEMWLRYKQEKGQTYKPIGLTNLLQRLKNELETNGKQFVIDEIKYSMGNNYSGICPAKEQKSTSATIAPSQYTEDDLKRYRRED